MTSEQEYELALPELLSKIKDVVGWYPTRTKQMINNRGAVEATKRMFRKTRESKLMDKLKAENKLSLSFEGHLWENKQYHHLFEQEDIDLAKKILEDYGYEFKN